MCVRLRKVAGFMTVAPFRDRPEKIDIYVLPGGRSVRSQFATRATGAIESLVQNIQID